MVLGVDGDVGEEIKSIGRVDSPLSKGIGVNSPNFTGEPGTVCKVRGMERGGASDFARSVVWSAEGRVA